MYWEGDKPNRLRFPRPPYAFTHHVPSFGQPETVIGRCRPVVVFFYIEPQPDDSGSRLSQLGHMLDQGPEHSLTPALSTT